MDTDKCSTDDCHNKKRKNGKECNKCESRRRDKRNPINRIFRNLKSRAKKRNIEFTIMLSEFIIFLKDNEYLEKRGRTRGCMNIDRIREGGAYAIDNIQVIEKMDNINKYHNHWREAESVGLIIGDTNDPLPF